MREIIDLVALRALNESDSEGLKTAASPTVRLVDIYTAAELRDETEVLGRLGLEFGSMSWEKVCAFPLPLKEVAAEHAATHWTNQGRKIKIAFRNATKSQRQLVAGKITAFEGDRIVLVDGNQIIDGNHHVMAAIKSGQPIKYVDLTDLPEGI